MQKLNVKFTLLIALMLMGFSVKTFGQDCNPPLDVSAKTPHEPDWYSVNVSWNVPSPAKADMVFTNGPVISHPGQGYGGGDVSAMMEGSELIGFIGNQELNNSIADEFTLTGTTQIDSIQFYTIQTLVADPSPGANVKEIYIQIYDGAPNAGGQVIWGDMTTDRKKQVIFPNYYRAPEDDLTNNGRPIMRTTALIGTSLEPGTYWLEVTVTSIIPTGAPQNARIVFPPVTIPGQTSTGNALLKVGGVWQDMIDPDTNGHCGLPMDFFGETSSLQYNVYRDDVKLTASPIENLAYSDVAPGEGTFVYGVTAVYSDGCESAKATSTVVLEKNPCEIATEVTELFAQGFEGGISYCWAQETDNQDEYWEAVLGDVSEPATAHTGSRKLLFQASGNATTKISTEMFDVTKLTAPELGFWHAQKALSGAQDELRVYYKSAAKDSWTKIGEFTSNMADWTWSTIELPNPSTTYWIAFEAVGKGGHGVMIDDVMLQEKGGPGCASPKNLAFTINEPVEEWYNVHLTWDYPEGSMPGDATELFNNGPIVTHPGAGFGGADVSAAEHENDLGFNTDQLSGYSIADDFTLEKPTYIEHMTFYLYEKYTVNNNPDFINMLFIRLYDKSPKEGGEVIWGDTHTNLINRELSSFSNVYRTHIDGLQDYSRPVMSIVADIDYNLAPGTYWVEIIAVSLVAPYQGGCIFAVPVTHLGEPYSGNAIQHHSGAWGDLIGGNGQVALAFEVHGKQMPLDYDIFRNGTKINTETIASNYYTDVAPGAGTYEYCIKAIWDNGCTSNGICVSVEMAADPCETAISSFPYHEGFENYDENHTLGDGCWRQEYVVVDPQYSWDWELVTANISTPNTAPEGNHKIIFHTGSGLSTKLVSPMFDLSELNAPTVNFWHAQHEWTDEQDILRLYYKNAIDGEWTLIQEWTNNIPNWVEETFELPNPTATYWLAFEGEGHYGRSVMLDHITVDGTVNIEERAIERVRIYPNPAVNRVHISGKNIAKIEIYDVMGRLVEERAAGVSSIELSSFSAGVYFFKVFDEANNFVTRKVVVTQ